ncbi:MAG: serine protease [Pseudomonadota bacterium]
MNFNDPDGRFDPKTLSKSERILVQAALSLTRDYFDELDGIWGRNSTRALKNYFERSENISDSSYVPNWVVMLLVADTVIEFRTNDWGEFHLTDSNLSFFAPDLELVEEKPGSAPQGRYKGTSTGLKIYYSRQTKTSMRRFHEHVAEKGGEISRQKSSYHWSTILRVGNSVQVVDSTRIGNRWSTFLISAPEEDLGRLNLILPTIRKGSPGLISVSRRFTLLTNSFEEKLEEKESEERARSEQIAKAEQQQEDKEPVSSTGTGFIVSQEGHLLTNAHVVRECETLEVKGHPASVIASDDQFDLALLQVPDLQVNSIATFATIPATLNSDVTVAGYPLSGLLGGLNVTRGSVTSLKGLAGDGVTMQISAPLQPGNSGGPAVNAQGAIVGVVVASLSGADVASVIGDIPQNVNFAIRGTFAQLFLHQNGITPKNAENDNLLEPEEIASNLSSITHLVKCN